MATLWQYDTLKATPETLKDDLNRAGKLGYQVIHIKESSEHFFVILARDTGRPIDEGDDHRQDWLVDVVTGPESQLT